MPLSPDVLASPPPRYRISRPDALTCIYIVTGKDDNLQELERLSPTVYLVKDMFHDWRTGLTAFQVSASPPRCPGLHILRREEEHIPPGAGARFSHDLPGQRYRQRLEYWHRRPVLLEECNSGALTYIYLVLRKNDTLREPESLSPTAYLVKSIAND